MKKKITVGFGRADYGPAIEGGPGCRRPMEINTAVFGGEDVTVAVVSADIIGCSRDVIKRVQERTGQSNGIAPQNVLFHATHTHSSPFFRDWGTLDVEKFCDIVSGCVSDARRSARFQRFSLKRTRPAWRKTAGLASRSPKPPLQGSIKNSHAISGQ